MTTMPTTAAVIAGHGRSARGRVARGREHAQIARPPDIRAVVVALARGDAVGPGGHDRLDPHWERDLRRDR